MSIRQQNCGQSVSTTSQTISSCQSPTPIRNFVTGIALIKDNTLITVSLDGKIKVWTFNTAKSEFEINTAVTQQLQSKMEGNQFTVCKVYEPLNTMVVGSKSGNVIMWNLSTMECAQTLIPTYVIPIIWYLDAYLRYLAQVFERPWASGWALFLPGVNKSNLLFCI
jgi:WD40 repeat protein